MTSNQEQRKAGFSIQVEALVPIRVESPSLDGCRLGLFSIDRGNREWVRKSYIEILTNGTPRGVRSRCNVRKTSRLTSPSAAMTTAMK